MCREEDGGGNLDQAQGRPLGKTGDVLKVGPGQGWAFPPPSRQPEWAFRVGRLGSGGSVGRV